MPRVERTSGESLVEAIGALPSVRDRSGIDRRKVLMRYEPGIAYYEDRLRRLGLSGRELVLDAGCGYGQWSVALGRLNRRVIALDPSDKFLSVAREALGELGHNNVLLVRADIQHLPFRPGVFDGAACVEVAFCVDEQRMTRELARVLRPGGLLYCVLCGPGYFLEYAIASFRGLNARGVVERVGEIGATIRYKMLRLGRREHLMFQAPSEMRREFEEAALEVVGVAGEGGLGGAEGVPPLRRERFLGLSCWWEMLGRRRGDPSRPPHGPGNTFETRQPRWFDVVAGVVWLAGALPVALAADSWPARRGRRAAALIPTVQGRRS